jgi:hypothetical protein
MQGNAFNAMLTATLSEFRRLVASPHAGQIRKQHAFGGWIFMRIPSVVRAFGHQIGQFFLKIRPVEGHQQHSLTGQKIWSRGLTKIEGAGQDLMPVNHHDLGMGVGMLEVNEDLCVETGLPPLQVCPQALG